MKLGEMDRRSNIQESNNAVIHMKAKHVCYSHSSNKYNSRPGAQIKSITDADSTQKPQLD